MHKGQLLREMLSTESSWQPLGTTASTRRKGAVCTQTRPSHDMIDFHVKDAVYEYEYNDLIILIQQQEGSTRLASKKQQYSGYIEEQSSCLRRFHLFRRKERTTRNVQKLEGRRI